MMESEAIIIARYYREGVNVRLEPLIPREDLPRLMLCTKHPRLIYFDRGECPCCQMMREYGITEPPPSLL